MSNEQEQQFFERISKSYKLSNNIDFLNWYRNSIIDGYDGYLIEENFININKLQELIDFLAKWYEIKYPNGDFDSAIYDEKKISKALSELMTKDQLLYRLTYEQACLIECNYRSNCGGADIIGIGIPKRNESEETIVIANMKSGLVSALRNSINRQIGMNKKDLYLEEVLDIITEKYNHVFDEKNLKQVVYNHDCDLELRHRILQLTVLKIVFSNRDIDDLRYSYQRAQKFVSEFNEYFNTTLSMDEVDELIKEYQEKEEQVLTKRKKLHIPLEFF